jgi:hypothetical protein
MALSDAFGADNAYDPSQGVDDLARQAFPGDIPEGYPADPGRLVDVLARRTDRKTRHNDENPPEVKPPSCYGEPIITGSKPSSFGEVVKPRGLRVIDLFWNIATSSTALRFDAFVPLATLAVGYIPLIGYLAVIGPYVPATRLIAIIAFGLVAFLVGFRISGEQEAIKSQKSQIETQIEAAANCGAPSVLIAYGEQDAEILRTCSLAGHFVTLEKRNIP